MRVEEVKLIFWYGLIEFLEVRITSTTGARIASSDSAVRTEANTG